MERCVSLAGRRTGEWTAMTIEKRLEELGITLPQPAAPVASYVPVVIAGGFAHVSGQLPFVGGALVTGRLGEDVSTEDGMAAARACGLMILAQLKAALGSRDRVERVVKLGDRKGVGEGQGVSVRVDLGGG